MPRLYLIRHGEPAATWGAHPDPGLSALGNAQAEAVAARLAQTGARNLISSPLARCQETAAPSAGRLAQAPLIERRVAEIPVPAGVEDMRSWLTQVMSGTWSDAIIDPVLRDWRHQIGQALLALQEDTLVFSHFVAINAAVGLATQSDRVTVFKPGHASVTILSHDGQGLRLETLGDEAAIVLT
jgi:broad specificity phosphatase PhoE